MTKRSWKMDSTCTEYAYRALTLLFSLVLLAVLVPRGSIKNMADDQQAEFDQAFAEAAVPERAPAAWEPVPHYPSPKYIEKNFAPEKTLTYGDISSLAEARKHAETVGVLTPALAEHLLPMAIVEGRSGNFGVNQGNAFSAKPSTLKRFRDMGLQVVDKTNPTEVAARQWDVSEKGPDGRMQYFRRTTIQGPDGPQEARTLVDPSWGHMVIDTIKGKKGKYLMPSGETTEGSAARLMAAVLAEKAATYGEGLAVERYNGSGAATELLADGKSQAANSVQYRKKVEAAKQMLAHPKNAVLMKHYNSVMKGKK